MDDSVKRLPLKETRVLTGHIASVIWNRNGEYVVSGSYDKTIRLWNPFTGKIIKIYRGHGYQIVGIAVHQDNSQIASCGGDKTPFVWDVSTGKVIRKFKGHEQRLNCISYNKECTVLVTGSFDTTTKIWDCRSHNYEAIQVLSESKDSIDSLYIATYEIITGSRDGKIRNYDMRMGELKMDTIGQPLSSISLSKDENILLASSLDSTIRLLDKDDGSLYHEYKGHKNSGYPVKSTFTNTDAFVVSGSEDGFLYWWSLEEGKLVHSTQAHKEIIGSIDYHPNKAHLTKSPYKFEY